MGTRGIRGTTGGTRETRGTTGGTRETRGTSWEVKELIFMWRGGGGTLFFILISSLSPFPKIFFSRFKITKNRKRKWTIYFFSNQVRFSLNMYLQPQFCRRNCKYTPPIQRCPFILSLRKGFLQQNKEMKLTDLISFQDRKAKTSSS